jgi:hypothetical protein
MTDHLLIDAQPAAISRARQPRRETRHTHHRIDAAGATRIERVRAQTVLAGLWSGLAVAILAYAITRASVGAAVIAVLAVWAIRVAWAAAWRTTADDEQTRPLTFIP